MIFDLQRYSTHDGPGIRTLVFFKGCPLACRWCQNPESRAPGPDILLEPERCIEGCRRCADACPEAIVRDSEGPSRLTRPGQEAAERLRGLCPSEALRVCGERQPVATLLARVLRDRPFFERSGGGVTLSGGEPFLQHILCRDLLAASKEAGIHTAVESCLHIPWSHIAPSLPYLDLLLADLKHVEEPAFHQWTGGHASRVLDNLARLAAEGVPMQIRVPLIPGFNADHASVSAIVAAAARLGTVREIHFLPYHILGMGKYAQLGLPYRAPLTPLDDPALLAFAEAEAKRHHLTPVLRG